MQKKPHPPRRCYKWRLPLFRLAGNPTFTNIIVAHIVVNVVLMSVKWHGQPDILNVVDAVAETYFTVVFLIEFMVKVCAWGE